MRAGFEPADNGVADRGLTTWLSHHTMSSPSRVWTYDPPVNSRMLYRWAIEEYKIVFLFKNSFSFKKEFLETDPKGDGVIFSRWGISRSESRMKQNTKIFTLARRGRSLFLALVLHKARRMKLNIETLHNRPEGDGVIFSRWGISRSESRMKQNTKIFTQILLHE